MTIKNILVAAACCGLIYGCDSSPQSVSDDMSVSENSSSGASDKVTDVFVDVSEAAGLEFVHNNGAVDEALHLPLIMGSGVALLDYDNDGDLDVYLVQGGPLEKNADAGTNIPGDRLFRNALSQSGKLTFTDVSAEANIDVAHAGMGAATADYDADGYVDLFVTAYGADTLLRNTGAGTFERIPGPWQDLAWSASASFFDYDGDGDLDLYVARYLDYSVKNYRQCFLVSGVPDYCSPDAFRGISDRLYRNDGEGQFSDVSQDSGIASIAAPGLGVVAADFNNDRLVDVYVANDGKANQLWINQGAGKFIDEALISGAAVNDNGRPEAGMGLTVADFDSDGDEDLFMTHLASETNTLYRNNGDGQFLDRTAAMRASDGALAHTGFGVAWFDYDNDGGLDLFVANGGVALSASSKSETDDPYGQTNLLYRQDVVAGKGLNKYLLIAQKESSTLNRNRVSRGAAFGDIDNDGDTDIVVTNNNGPVELLINKYSNTDTTASSLVLTFTGKVPNLNGLGAKVAILEDDNAIQWRTVRTDGSYLSANSPEVHFGLSNSREVNGVGVLWPSGRKEKWPLLGLEGAIVEGSGVAWSLDLE